MPLGMLGTTYPHIDALIWKRLAIAGWRPLAFSLLATMAIAGVAAGGDRWRRWLLVVATLVTGEWEYEY